MASPLGRGAHAVRHHSTSKEQTPKWSGHLNKHRPCGFSLSPTLCNLSLPITTILRAEAAITTECSNKKRRIELMFTTKAKSETKLEYR
eukprot:2540917-Amphidinium_carterae.1